MSYNRSASFIRDYKLFITYKGKRIEIIPPLRISFNGTKTTGRGFGINKLDVNVYGLKEETRNIIAKDPEQQTKTVIIELQIGYNGLMESVFYGTLWRGSNVLTDNGFVSRLTVFDGGQAFINSYTSETVTTKTGAIDKLVSQMENDDATVTRGKISKSEDLIRPKVLVGSTSKLIQEQLNDDEEFFIDNGKLNIIKRSEVIGRFIPIVSPQTGLLNTPERDFNKITFETLLNPTIKIGSRISLESVVAKQYNGIYRVQSIVYSGDLEGDEWKQGVTAFSGAITGVV